MEILILKKYSIFCCVIFIHSYTYITQITLEIINIKNGLYITVNA